MIAKRSCVRRLNKGRPCATAFSRSETAKACARSARRMFGSAICVIALGSTPAFSQDDRVTVDLAELVNKVCENQTMLDCSRYAYSYFTWQAEMRDSAVNSRILNHCTATHQSIAETKMCGEYWKRAVHGYAPIAWLRESPNTITLVERCDAAGRKFPVEFRECINAGDWSGKSK